MRVLVASCGIALDLEQLKDSHNRLIYPGTAVSAKIQGGRFVERVLSVSCGEHANNLFLACGCLSPPAPHLN